MRSFWLSLLPCLLLITGPSMAVEVENLYDADVVVSSQSSAVREQVMPEALSQVLVKVSGDSAILQQKVIRDGLARADSFVRQYRYAENEERGLILTVKFETEQVNDLLRAAGASLWGRSRPVVLLWLAVDDDKERRIIPASDKSVAELVEAQSDRRALPILLPIMDLEDDRQISVSDAWGQFVTKLQEASQRYGSDAVLGGAVQELNDGKWQARWVLSQGQDNFHWDSRGDDLESMIAAGVDGAADRLSKRYAVPTDNLMAGEVLLNVLQVNNASDYIKLSDYLKSLEPVTEMQVLNVQKSSVLFRLTLQSDVEALRKAISLNRNLAPQSSSGGSASSNYLEYRWIP